MKLVLIIQSVYFFVTGIWPILHINSFLKITGKKTDIWLVKTVAALICSIALSFFSGIIIGITLPVIILALTSSVALFIVDVYYVLNKTISKVYLLDAILELIFIIYWMYIII
jgi:hypothetical protein